MSKSTERVEAPRLSPWSEALRKGDCRQLMNLLEENPCQVVEKGDRGFTVLHAAAWRGCLKLLDQVFDLFGDNRRFVDEEEGIKLSLEALLEAEHVARERRMDTVGLTAAEYSWWSMGSCEARRYLLDGRRQFGCFASFQSRVMYGRRGDVEDGEGSLSPRMLLLVVLAHRKGLLPQRRREEFEDDMEYNFVADCEELRFHHACGHLVDGDSQEYVKAVIGGCVGKGPQVLRYLFQLRNAQGRTPLHVAVHKDTCSILVPLIPGGHAECLNMRDSRGWTVLHHLSTLQNGTRDLAVLLEDGRANVNSTVENPSSTFGQATAVHLAMLNNNPEGLKLLLRDPRTDVNGRLTRQVVFDEILPVFHSRFHGGDKGADISGLVLAWWDNLGPAMRRSHGWTALQLAAMVGGSPDVVNLLVACPRVRDAGFRQKGRNCPPSSHEEENHHRCCEFCKVPALQLAAAFGDPETLRIFMTNQEFDPLATCNGATALHFAVASSQPRFTPKSSDFIPREFNCPMEIRDFVDIFSYVDAKHKDIKQGDARTSSYEGREACINILVQAGPLDVWHKDDNGNFPEPGRSASSAYYLSWQRKVASETLEAKKGLNEAGNAISVVAALVATASYVGPLQPPLGYANDLVQSSKLLIRIFMVTNSISFYLAIASIMFAVVPSLPMPQEGMYKEWQRTRHTIGIAIGLLLMSVLGILISFAASSNVVVSIEDSWPHGGLAFYPEVVGGLMSVIGIIWFFIRLVRFMFPKSAIISQSLFFTKGKGK